MKKLLLVSAGIFLFLSSCFSQDIKDYIYLKNGTILVGTIIQEVPYDQIIVRTDDGRLLSFKYSEIEKITKKEEHSVELNQYGGEWSYGVALGGAGIIGLPVRYHYNKKNAIEFGTYYNPSMFNIYDKTRYGFKNNVYNLNSFVFMGGWNYYGSSYFKSHRQKIKLNGITIKGGLGIGELNSFIIEGGWIHESFKKANKKRSFTFELGPGYYYSDSYRPDKNISSSSLIVYWKLQWNLFI